MRAFIGFAAVAGGLALASAASAAPGVDIRYAVGASLVSVIATSSGAAAAYVKEGFTNLRVGMFLEIFTTLGALVGAYIAGLVSASAIAVVFGLVLLVGNHKVAPGLEAGGNALLEGSGDRRS